MYNNINTEALHYMSNIHIFYPQYMYITHDNKLSYINKQDIYKKIIIENFKEYYKINNKKLSIISIIRNPTERLLSSLFQFYHSDEISFLGKKEKKTTIYKLTENEIYNLYCDKILNNSLEGRYESIDEIGFIFDIDIINNLEERNNYYYFENDLIILYVLKFKDVIGHNNLEYLNNVLNINLTLNGSSNLSSDKIYYDKYITVKKMVSDDINNIIYNRYNKFYFI